MVVIDGREFGHYGGGSADRRRRVPTQGHGPGRVVAPPHAHAQTHGHHERDQHDQSQVQFGVIECHVHKDRLGIQEQESAVQCCVPLPF